MPVVLQEVGGVSAGWLEDGWRTRTRLQLYSSKRCYAADLTVSNPQNYKLTDSPQSLESQF